MKLDLKPLIRFLEVMPKSGEPELVLLKSHLVIEEILTAILCKSVLHDQYIIEARLTFNQKIYLVRAKDELGHSRWIWQALKLLNQARNELSHNLTTEQLNKKLNSFIKHVKSHNNSDGYKDVEKNGKISEFHIAAFSVYSVLSAHAHFDPVKAGFLDYLLNNDDA